MAAHRRSRTLRAQRASATLRAQEKHDRHRRGEEYLSGRYRSGVRAAAGEGILRVRRELYLAAAFDGGRAVVARHTSRKRAELQRRTEKSGFVFEWASAQ